MLISRPRRSISLWASSSSLFFKLSACTSWASFICLSSSSRDDNSCKKRRQIIILYKNCRNLRMLIYLELLPMGIQPKKMMHWRYKMLMQGHKNYAILMQYLCNTNVEAYTKTNACLTTLGCALTENMLWNPGYLSNYFYEKTRIF